MFVGVALVARYRNTDLISVRREGGRGGLAGGSLGWMTGAEWWTNTTHSQSVSQSVQPLLSQHTARHQRVLQQPVSLTTLLSSPLLTDK